MKIKKDEKLWMVPTRYWETTDPESCIGLTDDVYSGKHAYVFLEHYGYNVYVKIEDLFHIKENAIKVAEARAIIKDANFNDEGSEIDIDDFIEQVRASG